MHTTTNHAPISTAPTHNKTIQIQATHKPHNATLPHTPYKYTPEIKTPTQAPQHSYNKHTHKHVHDRVALICLLQVLRNINPLKALLLLGFENFILFIASI